VVTKSTNPYTRVDRTGMPFMNGDLLEALVVVVTVAVVSLVYLAWFASRVKVYRCSACGQEFRAKGWAGRVGATGVPGAASYYTTCPKCGKRSRNLLVGYATRHKGSK
jgi:DNA-directed RNA polymerase subunit RPC12/RpoP